MECNADAIRFDKWFVISVKVMSFISDADIEIAGRLAEGNTKLAKSLVGADVFLSHQRNDRGRLAGAIKLLSSAGATVYVDEEDPLIKVLSSDDRCKRLRELIKGSRRLVVLISENTAKSKWIPWELGLADGSMRNIGQVATMPVSAAGKEEEWGTQEYFGLYPQIRPDPRNAGELGVRDPRDSRWWTLKQWLSATTVDSQA